MKTLRAPIALLALARIGVLIERRAVEKSQAVRVFRKMRRHPIDNHADSRLMAAVHEKSEIVGRAEARRGREVADHLIAPRAGERMLHDGQQLDVRVAHQLHVLHQLHRHLAIAQPLHPRARMHFVDRTGDFSQSFLPRASIHSASFHWYLSRLPHHRRRFRRRLAAERVRIGLELLDIRRIASGRDTCMPRPRRRPGMNNSHTPPLRHRMGWRRMSQSLNSPATVTFNAFGAQTAKRTPAFRHVRAQRAIRLVERALGVQIEIGVGNLRTVAVRVVDLDFAPVPQTSARSL